MITATFLAPEVAGRESAAILGLQSGWATAEHLNILLECQQMLLFGGTRTNDKEAVRLSKFAQIAIWNIRERYKEKGKFGATGEELSALRLMVDYSDDWWKRQAGSTFTDAFNDVQRLWDSCREENADKSEKSFRNEMM